MFEHIFKFLYVYIFIVNHSWVNLYCVNAYLQLKLFEIEIEIE